MGTTVMVVESMTFDCFLARTKLPFAGSKLMELATGNDMDSRILDEGF
uniref:Uncharacterized protein n=1 Tax=Rhizophora mucronata TaxID=61149 RepID=A0A2P2PRN4_RHIMU